MKSALKKLRGTTVKTSQGPYTLKDHFNEEVSDFDFIYYTLDVDGFVAKVYNLQSTISAFRFQNQTINFKQKKFHALAQCVLSEQFKIGRKLFGLILLKDIIHGTSLKEIGYKVTQLQLTQLACSLVQSLLQLKNRKFIFCNFKPSNIFKTSSGQYKLINCQYMQRQAIRDQFPNILMHNIQKDFRYIAPQFFDQYHQEQLNYSCDIFSIGCILYLLKYGNYPFQGNNSTLNCTNSIKQGQSFLENTIFKFINNIKVRRLLNLRNILNQLNIQKQQLMDIENKPTERSSIIQKNQIFQIKKSQFESQQEQNYDDYGLLIKKKQQPSTGSSFHLMQQISKDAKKPFFIQKSRQNNKKKLQNKSISFQEFGNLIGSNKNIKQKKILIQKSNTPKNLNKLSFQQFQNQKKLSFQEFKNLGLSKPNSNKISIKTQCNSQILFQQKSQCKSSIKNQIKSQLRSQKRNSQALLNFDNIIKQIKQVSKLQNPFGKSVIEKYRYKRLKNICDLLNLKQLKQLLQKNIDLMIDYQDLKFQKQIGSGSAGTVYLGTLNSKKIAIKKVKVKQNPNALKEFQRQLITLIKMRNCQNLVSLIGLTQYKGQFYLLTQYCQYGSLFDVLHKKVNSITLSWKDKIDFALQIAEGMKSLHPKIIHRDLKSLNVFVTKRNQNWKLKVADFGLSRNVQSSMMTTQLGTIHWMAPQLLQSKQYSQSVDVYSFGILLWQILSRKTPYSDITSPMGIMKYVIIDKKRPHLQLISKQCPQSIINLMKKCWHQEPRKRMSFEQIIKRLKQILKQIQFQN